MICCLLSLLAFGVDPRETTEISLPLLLVAKEGDTCSHKRYTPAELAECLEDKTGQTWPELTKTGWQVLCHILRVAEEICEIECEIESESESGGASQSDLEDKSQDNSTDPGFSLSCMHHFDFRNTKRFGKDRTLGHLWAAAQAELLTYRRQREEDPWTSEKFDLPGVLKCLKERAVPSIPLVRRSMMKPYCACGLFEGCYPTIPPIRNNACYSYISNMNQYSREPQVDDEALWK